MFTHLTSTPDPTPASKRMRKKRALSVALLSGTLLLGACQEQTTPTQSTDTEGASVKSAAPVTPSDSAAARIEAFQPRYVMQKQALQRRLQAEYESLQAADTTNNTSMPSGVATDAASPEVSTDANNTVDSAANDAASRNANTNTSAEADAQNSNDNTTASSAPASTEGALEAEDINTNIEAGERDLSVLQKVTLEPRAPEQLDEKDIIEQYQNAMRALYANEDQALTAEQMNTLINVASLVPGLFEHTEIADRLVLKSPALARLIVQHQVWQQIEAQQAIDMQNVKKAQQAEFEALMDKFNSTMKDYDEQIQKYEETLKSYQQN